jgi:hypothetical protein
MVRHRLAARKANYGCGGRKIMELHAGGCLTFPIGVGEQRGRHGEAERLRGAHVQHQFHRSSNPRVALRAAFLIPAIAGLHRPPRTAPNSRGGHSHLQILLSISMERRKASARPIVRLVLSSSKALVINFTVASEFTAQCETKSARAPA